jgi:hypothetical protein
MKSKRWLLIIPLVSVICWSVYKPSRNLWYMAPVALICGFSILYNIPWLVRILHMKPFYYEDLDNADMNNEQDIENRYKFQNWFTMSITILQSVVFCVVLDYLVQNFNNSNLKYTDILIFVGSFTSLYTSIQDKVGRLLLACFMRRKNKELHKRIVSQTNYYDTEHQEIELEEIVIQK